jgi:glycerophosphoryl diester phosphodiesterase
MTLLSVLFIFGGGFLLIASQVSEYAISQRPLSEWIYYPPIAHRGLYNNTTVPENSLSAFRAAIAKGYAIELDVQLSQDSEVLIFHDHDLERITGQSGTITKTGYIKSQEYRLWQTLETIPTLKQALNLVQGQVPLFIELKNSGEAGLLEYKVLQLLTGYKGPVMVISFNAKTLEWFRLNAPELYRGQNLLLEAWHPLSLHTIGQQFLKKCKMSKPHVIIYNALKLPPLLVKILSWFKPFIAYNVTSLEVASPIRNITANMIFEHFEPHLP